MVDKVKEFLEKNRTLVIFGEILSAIIVTLMIVFGIISFIDTITTFLMFMVILEVMRMIREFIKSQTVKISIVLDSFIIFFIREIVLVGSNTEKYTFAEQVTKIGLFLVIIFLFFIFRVMSLKYSPSDKNCEKCPAITKEMFNTGAFTNFSTK